MKELKQLCKKVENKRNALTIIALYLDQKQIEAFRAIFFIQRSFTLLPEIWTFSSRLSKRIINTLRTDGRNFELIELEKGFLAHIPLHPFLINSSLLERTLRIDHNFLKIFKVCLAIFQHYEIKG